MPIGAKDAAFATCRNAGFDLFDGRRVMLAENLRLRIHPSDKTRTDGEDFNSLSTQRFFSDDLPFVDVGAGAHWQRQTHGRDRIKENPAKRQLDHCGDFPPRRARNPCVKKTDVRIA